MNFLKSPFCRRVLEICQETRRADSALSQNRLCENLLKECLFLEVPLLRGLEGLLKLTQVVHNAVYLTGRERALLARVAQLPEFVFERLAYANPVL